MRDADRSREELLVELAGLRREKASLQKALHSSHLDADTSRQLELLDSIGIHVFYLTDPVTYGTVNKAHAVFLGFDKADLAHGNISEILGDEIAVGCIAENQQVFNEKKQIISEGFLQRADGEQRLFTFTRTPRFGEDGRVDYVVCTGEDITDKKNAERLLTFTQFTIDQAQIAIFWCHADGHFFYVNRTACEWLQYSFKELQKMHVADINPEFPREAWDDHWQEIKAKGMVYMESVHRRKNGEIYPVELYSNYVQFEGEEYKLSFVSDISDRVVTREALEASQLFLENVIESIQDGVSVLDKDFNIVHTNRVMKEWYQDDRSLVGQKCYQAYHCTDQPCKPCPTSRALLSGTTESAVIAGKPGSSLEWLEVFSYPIKDSGSNEITGVVEFVRDISGKVKLERQLSQAQKMEAVGTLSGGIAHDYNNILQAILGSIQLMLAQKSEDHPDRKYLTVIEKSVTRAQELTARLLYFSRNIESDLQPVDLNKEMVNLVKLLERSLPKMVAIKQVHGERLKTILADIVQVEQVILNLAINAGHAMPDGGELLLQTDNISIDGTFININQDFHVGEYVVLTVSDTGTGMSEETLSHIYEPFYTTKPAGKGTGLGLSMVYGIVKNHGGVITCYSEEGLGTTFKIYIPAIEEAWEQEEGDGAEYILENGDETILVVDDEEILLDLGCEFLEQYGYQTIRASSGEEALAILSSRGDAVDLVLLDLNMPGIGGYKCLAEMRKLATFPKVIVASGYASNGSTQHMLESGARAFLGKPFQIKELVMTVRRVLDEE